jgi:hypothetical protein
MSTRAVGEEPLLPPPNKTKLFADAAPMPYRGILKLVVV